MEQESWWLSFLLPYWDLLVWRWMKANRNVSSQVVTMNKHPEAVIAIYISRVPIAEVQPAQHPVTKAKIHSLLLSAPGVLLIMKVIPAIMEVVKKK